MGNVVDNKFTWVIKNFTSQSKFILSDVFVIGGCKWRLMAFTKGHKGSESLSLYLAASGFKTLPCGWKRHAKYRLTVVNQLSDKLSQRQAETQHWFDRKMFLEGYPDMIRLNKLHARDGGFLVNNEVKIVVEVDVLQVIGKLNDVSNESQEVTQPLKRIKLNDDNGDVSSHLHKKTSSVKELIVDVNGFQVLRSQVDFAKRVFERYPEIAIECRTKNQDLRTSYMNVLLSLIKMLFKSPLDEVDLSDAESALGYIKNVGFKLDWLEKKLDQVKENKIKSARVYEMEQQLHDLKQKCKDLETQINKDKAEILEATASSDDLFFSGAV